MTAPLEAVQAALSEHFGQQPARARVSFVGVEPIEVLRFAPSARERVLVSLGMSRHAMAPASADVLTAAGPRAELLLHAYAPAADEVWRRVALLAAAPAVESVVYVAGMTVDLGEPLLPGSRCTGAVIAASPIPDVATSAGPVAVLRLLPATATELAYARVHGSAALQEQWRQREADLPDLMRPSAEFG